MRRILFILALAALCFGIPSAMLAADSNPNVGTWKLNLEKSTYPAGQAPKSLMRTVTIDGDNVKYSFEGQAADGSSLTYSFTTQYDDKDTEITGTGPFGADHISIKRVNSHMYTATLKKGDKVTGTSHTTISHDGKTATINGKGVDKDGKPVKTNQVYDKQ
jgi:hypothetical protein